MSFLPPTYLQKHLLFVGTLAVYNAVQCFIPSIAKTRQIYSGQKGEATALASRFLGLWTATSGLIRMYAAYNIQDRVMYTLAMWTFALAFFSFSNEVFIFKTAKWSSPGVWPALVLSTVSLIWMWNGQSGYVVA
ncbi:hypothetical protein DFS34DRAFT_583847 [Phlyctochytrium arcticum]|nr:hypothetical protein DFS34DRAFT_583847 [Phlyctochytrium arcticum]